MEEAFSNILFMVFIGGVLVLAVSLVFYYQFLRRRAFLEIASELGLQYYYRSYAIPRRFAFLHQQRRGRGRHAFNILRGYWQGAEVLVFDYKFNTGIGREKTWHYCSFSALRHARTHPAMRIYPKAMMDVLGNIFGFDEVFLNVPEFDDKFTVYSVDEAYARQVCVPPLIEYLLRHPEFSIEVEDGWMALGVAELLAPEQIPKRLRQLEKIRAMLAL